MSWETPCNISIKSVPEVLAKHDAFFGVFVMRVEIRKYLELSSEPSGRRSKAERREEEDKHLPRRILGSHAAAQG